MKVLFLASEVAGLIKTGGLADVAKSLPAQLKANGHDVRIVMPCYSVIKGSFDNKIIGTGTLNPGSSLQMDYAIRQTFTSDGVEVWMLDYRRYYERTSIYGDNNQAYWDNGERFAFLASAALDAAKVLNFSPDIVHCNDWHTAMIPVYMKINYKDDPFFKNTKNFFSIHNIAYQGQWFDDLLYFAQIDHKDVWNCWGLEHFGMLNWMKGAINYSDKVIVVSPNYANEIKTYEGGKGLDWTLNHNAHKLLGILNGVDYSVYNPQTDKNIVKNYDINHIENKEYNKKAVLKEFGLPYDEGYEKDKPLIAVVSRLVEQKGFDLFGPVCEEMKGLYANFVVLGTGAQHYEDMFRYLSSTSSNIRAKLEFSAELGNLMYAGADMFLMPSAFEPCGLSQLIALKYGAIPIVRATGGLDDTITGYPLENGDGFKFWNYSPYAMMDCIRYALNIFKDKKDWQQLTKNAMNADFSWKKSAQKYVEAYEDALRN